MRYTRAGRVEEKELLSGVYETELEEAGWKRVTQRQANQMKKSDMRAIFNLVDGDKGVLNN